MCALFVALQLAAQPQAAAVDDALRLHRWGRLPFAPVAPLTDLLDPAAHAVVRPSTLSQQLRAHLYRRSLAWIVRLPDAPYRIRRLEYAGELEPFVVPIDQLRMAGSKALEEHQWRWATARMLSEELGLPMAQNVGSQIQIYPPGFAPDWPPLHGDPGRSGAIALIETLTPGSRSTILGKDARRIVEDPMELDKFPGERLNFEPGEINQEVPENHALYVRANASLGPRGHIWNLPPDPHPHGMPEVPEDGPPRVVFIVHYRYDRQ